MIELIIDGLLANVGIGVVSLLCLSSLAKRVPGPVALALILVLFVVRNTEFRDEDLGVSQIPVIPMYSMCQEAGDCRGSAWNENLESLQAH